MRLLQIKSMCRLVKPIDILLELFEKVLQSDNVFPHNFNKTKQLKQVLGSNYHIIHACKNDCVLFGKRMKI